MAEPVTTTVAIDLPASANADHMAGFLPYFGLFALAGVCAIISAVIAAVLARRVPALSTRKVVGASATVSIMPLTALIALSGIYAQGGGLLYNMVLLLPAIALCATIALFISAPAAWLAARRRKVATHSDIFE